MPGEIRIICLFAGHDVSLLSVHKRIVVKRNVAFCRKTVTDGDVYVPFQTPGGGGGGRMVKSWASS